MKRKGHISERVCNSLRAAATVTSVLCAIAMSPSLAMAAPIGNASFGIGGAFTLPAGSNLGNTDSIFISNGGMIIVSSGDTMNLSSLGQIGNRGILQDLPSNSGFMPITSHISLNSGAVVLIRPPQTSPSIVLPGNVVIHLPEFVGTPNVPTITDTSVDALQAESVPEPISLVLFGLGLIGLGILTRRRLNPSHTI